MIMETVQWVEAVAAEGRPRPKTTAGSTGSFHQRFMGDLPFTTNQAWNMKDSAGRGVHKSELGVPVRWVDHKLLAQDVNGKVLRRINRRVRPDSPAEKIF